jgi:4,5-dihydroxyphthalate decarboxylase
MADEIEVQIPWMRYDITMPLMEGRVPIEGVKLIPSQSAPRGTAGVPEPGSPIATGDFGMVELVLNHWGPGIRAGWAIVGLPLFVKRKPVYTLVWTRAEAGINAPRDLEGKRVWAGSNGVIAIWLKGFLRYRHSVDLEKVVWLIGQDAWPSSKTWRTEPISDRRKNPYDMLIDGDADAIMTDISDGPQFEKLENDPRTQRLFPNFREEDVKLYNEMGILTPMHTMVLSKKLDQQYPDLAAKLLAAFEKSKEIAYQDIVNDRAGFPVIYEREAFVDQSKTWGDPFKYGITPNKTMIDSFNQYTLDLGLVDRPLTYEELFAAGTLDS